MVSTAQNSAPATGDVLVSNLDVSAAPGKDFFTYANAGFARTCHGRGEVAALSRDAVTAALATGCDAIVDFCERLGGKAES